MNVNTVERRINFRSHSWHSLVKEVLLNRIGADATILHRFQLGFVFRLFLQDFFTLQIENLLDRHQLQTNAFSLRGESEPERENEIVE